MANPDRQWRSTPRPCMRKRLARALALLLALPAAGLAPLPAPVAAQEEAVTLPDFSQVTTMAAARRLAREGRLVRITLFPVELGGPDDAENLAYITPEAAESRAMIVETLDRFLKEGLVDQLMIEPEYADESVVPTRITMSARHSEKDSGIELAIEVW